MVENIPIYSPIPEQIIKKKNNMVMMRITFIGTDFILFQNF